MMLDTRATTWDMPGAAVMEVADRALLAFYALARRNTRRLIHLVLTLLPLMALLVGSCETSQLPWVYSNQAAPEQLRTALFPDRINFRGAHYYPAAGYVARAQTFVVGQPESLMMLTQQEIGYLFGKPTLHRQDADAEVWQYKAGGCVVDFYFYDAGSARNQSKLSYVDVRTKEELIPGSALRSVPVSSSERSDCLHDVMKRDFLSVHV